MTDHAVLAPSSAWQWVCCTGSVGMQAPFAEPAPTEIQAEGNAAHWAGAIALKLGVSPYDLVGRCDPDKFPIESDIAELSTRYVDAVRRTVNEYTVLHVEQRLEPGRVHPDNWGTPDCFAWEAPRGVLDVFDAKFGYKLVEHIDNWQLINYAELVLSNLGVGLHEHITVRLHIIQPRAYHRQGPHRTWTVKASDLRPYINRLEAQAAIALSKDAVCTSGDHCYKCLARHACDANLQSARAAFEYVSQATPLCLNGNALGSELSILRAAKLAVDERLDGIEAETQARLQKGALVNGWALDRKPGRLHWNKPTEEILDIGDLLGTNLRKDEKPITPTQALQLGVPSKTVASLSVRRPGSLALTPETETLAYSAFRKDK